ncbi:putative ribonuclease H-like domain-containing protein [Tanacetum coccineum]
MVPRAVLMNSGLVSLNTARQVNTVHPKITMNSDRPMTNLSKLAHSTVKWPIHKNTTFKNSNFNQRVNTVKDKNVNTVRPKAVVNAVKPKAVVNVARPKVVVNDVKGNNVNVVKASFVGGLRNHRTKVLDHVSKHNSASITLKKFDYVYAQGRSKSVMAWSYEEINEWCVEFGGNPKEGKSQNIIPKGGLTCLFEKDTSDESELWHIRLGHINFKTMNKLVKGNLVRGLPSKLFESNQTCVACQKGKQHRASCLWVFFLATKDETSGIIKSFITRVENPIDQRVKVSDSVEEDVPQAKIEKKTVKSSFAKIKFIKPKQQEKTARKTINHVEQNRQNTHAPSGMQIHLFLVVMQKVTEETGKEGVDPSKQGERDDQEKDADDVNNINNVNAASTNKVNAVSRKTSIELLDDPNMPELEDIVYSDDDEDVGAKADMNNLDAFMPVSPIPTTRVHKDHPVEQIIGDLNSTAQTRRMTKNLEEHHLFSSVQQRTNHKDFQNCLFACFYHRKNPKRKRAIGTKWVSKNKKDKRGIVIKNKARLVAQGYTQEEGINYDEVFAPVSRIETIRLFLAYALFKYFMVYKMDVKSAFLYGKIEEEVYVCQPPGFEDPDFLDRVYKVEKALYGLHQAPRAWYETFSTFLLDNGFQRGKIDKTLFIRRDKVSDEFYG